jgi:hypothetical protein
LHKEGGRRSKRAEETSRPETTKKKQKDRDVPTGDDFELF